MDLFLETERLYLRRLTVNDHEALSETLCDPQVMYAWEHGFSAQEVDDFIARMLHQYETNGHAYFAAVEKESGRMVGVIGLLEEEFQGEVHACVGYILSRAFWGRGYACEGAAACARYAFEWLGADAVYADIRPNNTSSRKLAERLGMTVKGEFDKFYYGVHMPHLIYSASHTEFEAAVSGRKCGG